MKKKLLASVLSLMLAAACFTACGDGESSDKKSSSKDSSQTETSSAGEESSQAADESKSAEDPSSVEEQSSAFDFPKGADSEYELYQTIINYLNNGFHMEELKEVWPHELTVVFAMKAYEPQKSNFTHGMKYDEACQFIAKLQKIAAEMDWPKKENGAPADKLDDYSSFEKEFPESLQQQIKDNHRKFEKFIYNYIYLDFQGIYKDGENPFVSDLEKTRWELLPESEFKATTVEEKNRDDNKDFAENFPQMYNADLGEYRQGNDVIMMDYNYTKINGKYYLVSFNTTVGSVGG